MQRMAPASAATRVLIVDDHEVVREGLVGAFAGDPRWEVVGAVAGADEAIQCAKRTQPDVALVDLRLRGSIGTDVCRGLVTLLPSIRVVVLTSYLSEATVREALAAGAAGYVTKAAGLPELRRVLADLAEAPRAGGPPGPSQIVKKLHDVAASQAGGERLTPQQHRVMELAAAGLTNEAIGRSLLISESTVRFHLGRLKDKLGVRTKTALVARAIRAGLIAPAEEDGLRVRP